MAEPSASTHAGTDNNQNNGESTVPEEGGFGKNEDEDYGYYFYPHRETPDRAQQESVWNKMWEGRKAARKFKCEANVRWCLENSECVLSAACYWNFVFRHFFCHIAAKSGLASCN